MNRSRLEIVAEQLLKDAGYEIERELKFHPKRRWRADFRVCKSGSDDKVLVECEGLTRYGNHLGRHQTPKGFEADCEKYNAAALLGWTVFRFTERMIIDGTMVETLCTFFSNGED